MLVEVDGADAPAALAAVLRARRRGRAPVVLDPSWPPAVRAAAERSLHAVRPAEGSLGAFSSGSSRRPRLVLRSWASWEASHPPFCALTGIGPGSTVLVTGPLSASLHLYGAVHAVDVGATLVLAQLDDRRPWDVVHVVPAGLDRLLAGPLDLAGRTAVCAGDALPPSLAARAADRGLRVVAYYGATELSFVAAAEGTGSLRPFRGVEVEVRDGTVWARSPYLCTEVLGDPPLRRDSEGFATVEDLGELAADGSLRVLGRADEAVTTGGATVHVEAVEVALRGAPGVTDVAVVGTPHAALGQLLAAVVEAAGSLPPPARRLLRDRAAAAVAPAAVPRRWYVVPALPRTPAGKVARGDVRRGLAEGTLGAQPLA